MFKISSNNKKLGLVDNINLPALVTCPNIASCRKYCYANKGFYRMPSVKNRYSENLQAYQDDPLEVLNSLIEQLNKSKATLVRWHASGDVPDYEYLVMVHAIAKRIPDKRFLMYTKRYKWVNDYISKNGTLDNLTIVFSHDEHLEMNNPYNLPMALLVDKHSLDSTCPSQFIDGMTCDKCTKCWNLTTNHNITFKMH